MIDKLINIEKNSWKTWKIRKWNCIFKKVELNEKSSEDIIYSLKVESIVKNLKEFIQELKNIIKNL